MASASVNSNITLKHTDKTLAARHSHTTTAMPAWGVILNSREHRTIFRSIYKYYLRWILKAYKTFTRLLYQCYYIFNKIINKERSV